MSIDLLLRALRKCVAHSAVIQLHRQIAKHLCGTARQRRVGKATYKICEGYDLLADKIHKKIVERFERLIKAGRELYVDKLVREKEIAKFDNTTVRCCNRSWFASVGSQFKCPLCGEEKLLLGIVK